MCCSLPTEIVRSCPSGKSNTTRYAFSSADIHAQRKRPACWEPSRTSPPNLTPQITAAKSWIVERRVLAVRRMPRFATAEMSRRYALPIALVRQQFDEPRLVFDLLVQNPRSHVVSSWILPERHVANLDPRTNRAALRLQQQRQNIHRRRRIRQLRRSASRLIVELRQIVRQFAAQFVNTRNDQLPVRPIFQTRIF